MGSEHPTEQKPVEQIQHAAHQATRKETAARPVRRYRTFLFQAYLLAALIGFSALAVLASTSAYTPIDLTITKTLQYLNQPWFRTLMIVVSFFGYTVQVIAIVVAAAAYLYVSGLHWEALMSMIIAAAEEVLNLLIKTVIHRPRPSADLVTVFNNLGSFSFPSGHVMFYTAYFGFLFFLAFTLLKPSIWRGFLLVITGALVILVGFSRMYLGEHWASDVLGAYLVGSLILIAAVRVYRWGKTRFFEHQPVAPEAPTK
jgi:membrane-associated phospholipid phosphatase